MAGVVVATGVGGELEITGLATVDEGGVQTFSCLDVQYLLPRTPGFDRIATLPCSIIFLPAFQLRFFRGTALRCFARKLGRSQAPFENNSNGQESRAACLPKSI